MPNIASCEGASRRAPQQPPHRTTRQAAGSRRVFGVDSPQRPHQGASRGCLGEPLDGFEESWLGWIDSIEADHAEDEEEQSICRRHATEDVA